jgi:hypothetical protein
VGVERERRRRRKKGGREEKEGRGLPRNQLEGSEPS